MMRILASAITLALMGLTGVAADELVTPGRIKVFLFAAPAFISEVSVDAYDGQCLSLDNNLIDGRVQSFLVGGQDVNQVMVRTDSWYCNFYDNYDCAGAEDQKLTFPDGVNNLGSVGWGTRIHSLRCFNPARKSR